MTDYFDPNSLADELDRLLDGVSSPAPFDDPLIETALRLSHAPHPTLKPEAFARIQAQVLSAAGSVPPAGGSAGSAGLGGVSTGFIVLAVVLTMVAIALGAYGVLSGADDGPDATASTVTAAPEASPSVNALVNGEATTAEATGPASFTPQPETVNATPPATETSQPTARATDTRAPTLTRPPDPDTATRTTTAARTATAGFTPTADSTAEAAEDALPVTLIIEGPVAAITDNIMTIYNIPVVFAPDDPLLSVIVIGDIVRIEAGTVDQGGVVVIEAVNVTVVNIDVVVSEGGQVWRDNGSCSNPPPDWAPAVGWRARCQPQQPQPGGPPDNPGRGRGPGDDDDDDDG